VSDPQIQGKGSRLTKMEAMTDADKKINAILTPDQQKMYAQIEATAKQKAMQKKQAKMGTPPPPPAPPVSQSN
jgi:Spy/CpxP family protein refolding chaperone